MKASIDIGSNSIILLVTSVTEDGFEDVASLVEIAGLGSGIDATGELSVEAIQKTIKILKKFIKEAGKFDFKPQDICVTATEACRVARNANEFLNEVEKELQLKINVITGEAEAILTAKGICHGINVKSGLTLKEEFCILDIGGASTELIKIQRSPFKVLESISLPIGSVRAKDFIEKGIFQEKMDSLFSDFDLSNFKSGFLVGVAGTLTSLAAMLMGSTRFEENKVNGLEVEFQKLDTFIGKISKLSNTQLETQYPFLGKRSETIIPGSRVARAFGLELETKSMTISTLGLRYGSILYDELPLEFLAEFN